MFFAHDVGQRIDDAGARKALFAQGAQGAVFGGVPGRLGEHLAHGQAPVAVQGQTLFAGLGVVLCRSQQGDLHQRDARRGAGFDLHLNQRGLAWAQGQVGVHAGVEIA